MPETETKYKTTYEINSVILFKNTKEIIENQKLIKKKYKEEIKNQKLIKKKYKKELEIIINESYLYIDRLLNDMDLIFNSNAISSDLKTICIIQQDIIKKIQDINQLIISKDYSKLGDALTVKLKS